MKGIKRTCAAALAGALTALALGTAATPAQAEPLDKEHFHEVTSEVVEDFCGDLTVRIDTDNGDGTLTVLFLATGAFKVYGPDGEFLFNDPGQVRFELLIDHAGTPTDPFDDEFLEFLGIVKGSTGRNDTQGRDFCADIHEFIG